MTEKITGQGFRPVDAGAARRTEKSDARTSGRPVQEVSAPTGDTVNVERSELLLARLERALQAAPAVDAGRVQALKDAIASGAYEIDPAAIADKILRLEREIGG